LEHEFYDFPIILGISSSQLTKSIIFQRGWLKPPTRKKLGKQLGSEQKKPLESVQSQMFGGTKGETRQNFWELSQVGAGKTKKPCWPES